jgi:hypothetical protein
MPDYMPQLILKYAARVAISAQGQQDQPGQGDKFQI